ncbi:unnamed protein product [Peniophora sp. CBMAI 1063]|nr:unnamed protein product [Peniophora sp. CBMAI 1063]
MPSPTKADYTLLPLHESPPPAYSALPQNHTTTQGPEPTTPHSGTGSHNASRERATSEDLSAHGELSFTDACADLLSVIRELCVSLASIFSAIGGILIALGDLVLRLGMLLGHLVKVVVFVGMTLGSVYVIARVALSLYHEFSIVGGRANRVV